MFKTGDLVYLKAAHVFDGLSGTYINRPDTGPLVVEKVYVCGEHTRLKAVHDDGFRYHDANIKSFAPIV
jgi:hypothetical protein